MTMGPFPECSRRGAPRFSETDRSRAAETPARPGAREPVAAQAARAQAEEAVESGARDFLRIRLRVTDADRKALLIDSFPPGVALARKLRWTALGRGTMGERALRGPARGLPRLTPARGPAPWSKARGPLPTAPEEAAPLEGALLCNARFSAAWFGEPLRSSRMLRFAVGALLYNIPQDNFRELHDQLLETRDLLLVSFDLTSVGHRRNFIAIVAFCHPTCRTFSFERVGQIFVPPLRAPCSSLRRGD
ncbi:hypothetical protein ABIE89_000328 [Bradyrhizobium niftali]